MATLHGFPYFDLEFDRRGELDDPSAGDEALRFLQDAEIDDLFVISHGWNNDMAEARALYDRFFDRLRAVLDAGAVPAAAGRHFAVLGILWPSKRFAEQDLIPSGAAGLEAPVTEGVLEAQVDDLEGVFDAPDADATLRRIRELIPHLEDRRSARKEFADLTRSLLHADAPSDDDASTKFFKLPGDELMKRLSKPVIMTPQDSGAGGAAALGDEARGDAAGFGQFFSGFRSAARNLLNLTTYYQMKERAGTVGAGGVCRLLQRLREARPDLKLHLIGHSFGARLVTAAITVPPGAPAVLPDTLALLQAAFSHYGFAEHWDGTQDGFFRRMVRDHMVKGAVLITHTRNDKAVGLAYPLASLVAGQVASGFGDENDQFGGLGRNGAQKTPEAVPGVLQDRGAAYAFEGGHLYNLKADDWIMGHSDIANDQVAYALLTAVTTP